MTVTDSQDPTAETRFGAVAYREESVLEFPLGLPGFSDNRRFLFARLPAAGAGFQLLHALDGDPVDLVVVPLQSLGERLADADVEEVRASLEIPPDDLAVLFLVTLPPRGSSSGPRVNLRAPVFVDVARRLAVQVVLPNTGYPFREPLRAA